MKALFTCVPAYGHFHPLVPLARALSDAGHAVAFATARAFHKEIGRAGFSALAAGLSEPEMESELARRLSVGSEIPAEQQRRRIATEIAPAAMLPDLLHAIDDWRPDLIVHEEGELTGPLAAALRRLPHLTHGWPAPSMPQERAQRIGAAMAPLWVKHGIEPDPLGGLFRHLYLDCCAPSLQRPPVAENGVVKKLRPVVYDAASDQEIPAWLNKSSGRRAVYVTFGTVPVFNRVPGPFAIVLEALRDEPLDVIVTVGLNNDPTVLGPQPDNIHIQRYVPQSLLLPHCDLVVCHGGASSTTAALAHGLPLLLLPRGGASQQRSADACVAGGVGRALTGSAVTADAVRREVRTLLAQPLYREAAGRVAEEIRSMPRPEEAVPILEQFAERR